MSIDFERKKTLVGQLSEQWATAQAVIVAENKGLSVPASTALRTIARNEAVELRVIKNSLARRAMAGTPFSVMIDHLHGPLLYGTAQDPVKLAKVLFDFTKGNEKLVLRGGGVGGRWLDTSQIQALAVLPSREVLLGRLLGTLQAPVTQFARTLQEVPTQFVRVLAAVRQAREAQAPQSIANP